MWLVAIGTPVSIYSVLATTFKAVTVAAGGASRRLDTISPQAVAQVVFPRAHRSRGSAFFLSRLTYPAACHLPFSARVLSRASVSGAANSSGNVSMIEVSSATIMRSRRSACSFMVALSFFQRGTVSGRRGPTRCGLLTLVELSGRARLVL